MIRERVCVVGGGTVGPLVAVFLARSGYRVTLIEAHARIATGAGQVAAVFHASGCEYPLDPTGRTGRDCVLGGVTTRLCLPPDVFNDIVDEERPTRFLISRSAVEARRISVGVFEEHALRMRNYYKTLFNDAGANLRVVGSEHSGSILPNPDRFIVPLREDQFEDTPEAIAGYAAAGSGINAAAFAATMSRALLTEGVNVLTGRPVLRVKRRNTAFTLTSRDGEEVTADQVVLTAGYRNIELALDLADRPPAPQNVHLNLATYIRFPAKVPPQICFTLVDQFGGMFATLERPQGGSEGLGILYWPAQEGSQYATWKVETGSESVPDAWDRYCRNGVPDRKERGEAILCHLSRLYPMLQGSRVVDVVARTVVNYSATREERPGDRARRFAPGLFGIVGTKWTNSVTAAIQMLHAVQFESYSHGRIAGDDMAFRSLEHDLDVATHLRYFPSILKLP